MTTTESNRIIAEWMGLKRFVGEDQQVFYDLIIGKTLHSRIREENIKYHTLWSWLMPVVEKVLQYRYPDYYGTRGRTEEDGEYDDCAHFRTFGMRDKEGNYMVRINGSRLIHAAVFIEATYNAVVDFIVNLKEDKSIN